MGLCKSREEAHPANTQNRLENRYSFTEQDEVKVQMSKLLLYIDSYNREAEKLNGNIVLCEKRAMEYKRQGQKNLALFYINKRKSLEALAAKYTQKSIMLSNRKQKIEEMEIDREFANALRETNDILQNHLNQNIIDEIKRNNEIDSSLQMQNAALNEAAYSDDVRREYERMSIQEMAPELKNSFIPSITKSRAELEARQSLVFAWWRLLKPTDNQLGKFSDYVDCAHQKLW